ncbi:MAG TPA: MMPL family transporter [Steroidobacteraceae bacterium]|nr:MMPL family transporter [Steroidobacteraceae bacterium]
MTRTGRVATAVWAAFVFAATVVVVFAHYTTDLSAFLPRSPTATQRLLVDQLREGIASRSILIGVEGADSAERARISLAMGRRLRADPQFVAVTNGEPVGLDRDRELLFNHRYLLSEAVSADRFTPNGLRDAVQETLDLLASPMGMLAKSLLPRDPTGEMLQIIDQLGSERQPPSVDGVWTSRDGKRALLVVQTRAAGSDTDGQEGAVAAVRGAFSAAVAEVEAGGGGAAGRAPATLEMSGPGVFSVAARATIKQQVTRLSIVSTMLITLMLLWVYRSFRALVLGLIPVASGALAGIAAVALGFGSVHGITLGFGVTLIGESVDYSIYLFIQSQQRTSALWSTIRLGVLTSIVGFMSLLPSGFPGLAQLGLFSISGLVAAALVTRYVLPNLMPPILNIGDVTPLGTAVAAGLQRVKTPRALLLVIPVLAAVVLYTHRGPVWNHELSALSPVSKSDQALDAMLRSDIGAPDVSYLVVVSGPSQEAVLHAAETVDPALDALVEQKVISGFESPARYLPSLEAQRARQGSLPPDTELKSNLITALDGLPLQVDRLDPFLHDVEAARNQPLLTRKQLEGTSLATGVDALLLSDGTRWSALLPLRVPTTVAIDTVSIDIGRVHSGISKLALGEGVEAVVLDVKGEVDRLYSSYLSEALRLSLAGFAGIVVLLVIFLRSPARTARVVTPLVLAVLTVTAGLVLLGQQLTILHLIGMLLIVAVGSNYALFFDRRSNDPHAGSAPLTLASLVIANAATVLGFGVLGFSSVPVLSALGSTVAPGAFLALVFSALLAGSGPRESTPVAA